MMSIKSEVILSILISLVIFFLYPAIEKKYEFEITIDSTGQNNIASKSAEIWLRSPNIETLHSRGNEILVSSGWEEKYNNFVSYRNQPSKLVFMYTSSREDSLVFAAHDYSGKAKVSINGHDIFLDLYRYKAETKAIPLSQYADEKKISWNFLSFKAFSYFLCAILFFSLISRFSAVDVKIFNNFNIEIRVQEILIYAAPSLLVYIFFHLTIWPGQMSPDSVDQWWQILNNQYSDNHPVIGSLIYKLFSLISETPEFVIFFQYVLLALAVGLVIAEIECWGVPKWAAILTSVVVPLYPANALIATTLWKDVLYTIFFILVFYFSLSIVRNSKKESTRRILIGMVLACAGLVGVRHNGIVVAMVFLLVLGKINYDRASGRIYLFGSAIILILFILQKLLFNPLFGIAGIGEHYKAMYAVHIIGAMVNSNVSLESADSDAIKELMPLRDWKGRYRCDSVVPLFWTGVPGNFDYMAQNSRQLNKIAWRLMKDNPREFFTHQICLTSFLWRISKKEGDWIPISPMEITPTDTAIQMHLVQESKFPRLKAAISNFVEKYVVNSPFFGRPALLSCIFIFLIGLLYLRIGYKSVLIGIPIAVHTCALGVLMSAQDYRYQFPVVLVSVLLLFLVLFGGRAIRPDGAI